MAEKNLDARNLKQWHSRMFFVASGFLAINVISLWVRLLSDLQQTYWLPTLVPVACWCVMLVVGMIKGMEAGTSLDIYTNGIIAVAFFLIGISLRKNKGM